MKGVYVVGRWVVEELDFVAPWLHLDGSTMHASPLALASVTGELEGTRGTSPAGASERARARVEKEEKWQNRKRAESLCTLIVARDSTYRMQGYTGICSRFVINLFPRGP